MATFQNQIGTAILTPPARLQFLHIEKPDTGGQYSDDKYKAHFLFSKTETDFSEMKAVVEELSQQAFGVPARELEFVPFKNGDEKEWQGFPGSIYVLAKSKYMVPVWSPQKDPKSGELVREDPKKLYPGCIARAHLAPLAYMSGNQRGITFILSFIQFLEDAPRFGGIGSVDARDILSEYVPGSARVSAVVNGAAKPQTTTEDAATGEPAPQPARGRGRPSNAEKAAKAETTTAETTEETPSARARRLAAEKRAADEVKGGVEDLPVASAKPAPINKPASSLMDMM